MKQMPSFEPTENKVEEAKEKFWSKVGSKIKEKAQKENLTEEDVLFDLSYLGWSMLKNEGNIIDRNLPHYLDFDDLDDFKKLSLDDMEELKKLVEIIHPE